MKLTTNKKDLLKLLERCNGVADKKSSVPAMANVLIEAKKGELHLSAMSLTQSVTGTVPAKVSKDGAVLVGCSTLLARINSMPDGELQLSITKDNALVIKHSTSSRKFQLLTIPADVFPTFPTPKDESTSITVPSIVMSSLIASTQCAISTDDTRLALSCLLVEFSPGNIRCVSTDGHRLNKADAKVEHDDTFSMMIPLSAVIQLKRIIDIGDKPLAIRLSESMAFFDADGTRFGLRLVDAQFPPYEQVIPNNQKGIVTIDRATLIASVVAMSSAVEKDKGIKLTIDNGAMLIESSGIDQGDGEEKLQGEGTGKLVTGLSPQYLVGALKSITGELVDIQFSDHELSEVVIVPSNKSEDFDVKCIVMPMRL